MAVVLFKDGTSFETPEENIPNVERLMGEKIKDIKYPASPLTDAVNELAKRQAALWNTKEVTKQKMGRPKKLAATK